VPRVSGMYRFGERRGRRLGGAVGIAGLVAVGIGAGTLHAQAAAVGTTTTLTSSSNPASSGVPVTLTATVVPASGTTMPAGTVQFMDGTTAVGTPQTVIAGTPTSNGTASVTDTFTKAGSGRHGLTATFTPTASATTTSSGTLPQDVMGTNASFVEAAYATMLGHPADTVGGNYWIDQLTNHAVPRSMLAMALASLPEYRTNVISGNGQSSNDFYDLYLHRQFDSAGASYWTGQMAGSGGMTFEQVRLRFAGSPEFFSSPLVGNNDQPTAIELLYQDLLGRHSDTAGMTYWTGHFSASTIAAQFLFSPEGRAYLVDTVYQQILVRPADSPGKTYWSNLLLSGASDENIIASILSSDEYRAGH
jgi:trimeric autotransporter adhesin